MIIKFCGSDDKEDGPGLQETSACPGLRECTWQVGHPTPAFQPFLFSGTGEGGQAVIKDLSSYIPVPRNPSGVLQLSDRALPHFDFL